MSERHAAVLGYCAALFTIVVSAIFQTPLVDDAFITFRYAANLADGKGLLYNPTELPVLGTTSPLWAVILAGAHRLGADIIGAAKALNLLFIVLAASILHREFIARERPTGLSSLIIPAVCLFPFVHLSTWAGMETPLYLLLLVTVFALRERFVTAAILAGLSTLVRPDGWIILAIVIVRAARRGRWVSFLPGLLLAGGWCLWAHGYYGGIFPHSIAAKRVVHPGAPLSNLLYLSESLTLHAIDLPVFIFAASGLVLGAVWRRMWPPLIWFLGYTVGLVFSGVKPVFYWYYAAPWFVVLGFGVIGLAAWGDRLAFPTGISRRARSGVVCILGLALVGISISRSTGLEPPQLRDLTYQAIAHDYRNQVREGDSVYACETGTLGYYFRSARMIDSSGINSPRVLDLRRIAPKWSMAVIEGEKPEWIISPRRFCQMEEVEKLSEFQNRYERVAVYLPWHQGGIAVYRRVV